MLPLGPRACSKLKVTADLPVKSIAGVMNQSSSFYAYLPCAHVGDYYASDYLARSLPEGRNGLASRFSACADLLAAHDCLLDCLCYNLSLSVL